jgi:phospholipid/cholesterol/gamma-HCH transport system permease protein
VKPAESVKDLATGSNPDAALSQVPTGGLTALLSGLGRRCLEGTADVGRATLFLVNAVRRIPTRPWRFRMVLEQMHFIGNRSILIVALTGAFTGLVLALQGTTALKRFGAESMVGALVSLSLTRELAPVLAALMITARAGSAMAATLGNMQVTEQIDALRSMAVDPMDYLVKPRLIAGTLSTPLLTSVFTVIGLLVARLFCVSVLGLDKAGLEASIQDAIQWSDVAEGLTKSFVFGVVLVWIATYRGYFASGGAKGVGLATTRAVVETSVLVLALDYALTALLF